MVEQRAPWLRQRALHKFTPNGPFVDLARRHLLEIAGERRAERQRDRC
jgi:hypothetical protein